MALHDPIEPRSDHLTMRMTPGLKKALRRHAIARGLSTGDYIHQILADHVLYEEAIGSDPAPIRSR